MVLTGVRTGRRFAGVILLAAVLLAGLVVSGCGSKANAAPGAGGKQMKGPGCGTGMVVTSQRFA